MYTDESGAYSGMPNRKSVNHGVGDRRSGSNLQHHTQTRIHGTSRNRRRV